MKLIPREEKFFDLFEELVIKIEEGGCLFMYILENYEKAKTNIFRLKGIEHEADGITHRMYEKMYQTFLTPFDREDIHALVKKMDSIVDLIESSAMLMYVYRIKEPAPELKKQACILNGAITNVKEVIYALRSMGNAQKILDACVKINAAENEGDVVLRIAVAKLFEGGKIFLKSWNML